jgi:hypothetical protein
MFYPESTYAQEPVKQETASTSAKYVSAYRLLLLAPTVILAGNPNDRPDVASAAILGYN